jgi:cellulose synthase/poly-beta-1,6-N-acetylglucosamine synthase-like glycosyltransferase
MNIFLIVILFLCLFLLIHSYIIYPLSIWILNFTTKKRYVAENNYSPKVSIIISVFNEEKVIEKTIRNFLDTEYDLNKIEFVIGSDNSNDSTNEIIAKLQKEIPAIKFFPFPLRRGKSQVLNDLVKEAGTEILIFSDANTIFHKDSIHNLVKFYADRSVGGVSGRLLLVEFEDSIFAGSQEKKYWDMESWLKDKEGNLGMLIGANGGIYSLRKEFFVPIPTNYPVMDDFYITLKVLEQGRSFIYTRNALAEEFTAPSIKSEFSRKVRNNSINLSTIKAVKNLLSPSFNLISYALWSHKIIRWFTPVLLLVILTLNIILISSGGIFYWLLLIQLLFYIAAILGYFLKEINIRIIFLLLCFYFLVTNIAMFVGIYKFIFSKHTAFWQSTVRQ